MDKILTVSIAAYNAEKYIRDAIESLLDDEVVDDLEIFVVDDGGKDGTLAIAQGYAEKYPQSVFPVHKENGGYGSTVNYSIAHATGKYFKLLDGDDWFETKNLKAYVSALKRTDVDVVVTPYVRCYASGERKRSKTCENGCLLNEDIEIVSWQPDRVMEMWALTYRTEVLRESALELPEHCLYTDQIFSSVPFFVAKTVRFLDICLYCYRIGHEGQSVSKESRIRHISDNLKVIDFLCEFYNERKAEGNPNIRYLKRRIGVYAASIPKVYLLMPMSAEVMEYISVYDRKLKKKYPDIYRVAGSVAIFKKRALYIWMIRILRYGKLCLWINKKILPPDGIAGWA